MPDWATFAAITVAVVFLLLLLSSLSRQALSDSAGGAEVSDAGTEVGGTGPRPGEPRHVRYGPVEEGGPDSHPPSILLVNVALTQGVFGGILLAGAWLADVPPSALGVTAATTGGRALALGVAFGIALAAANSLGGLVARRLGVDPGEELRDLLAPGSAREWALLLLVVLPLIASFEELLFRGMLVGAFSAGFGVSPWLLAAVSSAAFALGHGAQGGAGIAVTGVLGFVLAAGFILTGSLLVVVVAHYLVNALEFILHEGLGVELRVG